MIPPPVSTRTESPIQQGFAVQNEELLETRGVGGAASRRGENSEREGGGGQQPEDLSHGAAPPPLFI